MPTQSEPVFTVYQTTCLTNGKIYIGVHKTRDPQDSYLGSGKLMSAAVKKHGRDQFRKEVLFIFETRAEAYAKEKELVTAAFAKRADTYNLMEGGTESSGWYRDRRGSKNPSHGTVWIWMEGQKPRKVRKEVVGEWLVLGWERGRGPQFKEKMNTIPHTVKRKRGPTGRVFVTRDGENRSVLLEEVAALEEQGWVRGRYFTEEVRKVLQKIGRENGKKARRKTKLDWGKVREIRRL